jgi:4'-phosphopantetheinyl transferase EntD
MNIDRYRDYLQQTEHALAEVKSVCEGGLIFDGPARAQLFEAHQCLMSAVSKMRREVYEVEMAAKQLMANAGGQQTPNAAHLAPQPPQDPSAQ